MSTKAAASRILTRHFSEPDEHREIPKGAMDIITLDGLTVSYGVAQPGWSWDEHVKPLVGGDSCQFRHFGYLISGRMLARADDGTEVEIVPGTLYVIEPGHTGSIIGDEPAVTLEFEGFAGFGERRSG